MGLDPGLLHFLAKSNVYFDTSVTLLCCFFYPVGTACYDNPLLSALPH